MSQKRQLTARQLKDAYASGERNFREIEVLRESVYRGANLRGANLYGANLYGANLEGAKHFLSARIPFMSSRGNGALFTGTLYRDRLVVYAGCFKGTPDEFRAQVTETHGDNIHAQLYLAQLAVFEVSWRHWLTTLPAEETTAEPQS